MTDMYGEFDDSDDLEGNDEEIGALGSILSWDEDDDAVVGAAVAATSSALEERETTNDSSLPPFTGYPQQISITSGVNASTDQTYQMLPTFNYANTENSQGPSNHQPAPATNQPQARELQMSPAPAPQQPAVQQQHAVSQQQQPQQQVVAASTSVLPGVPIPTTQPQQQITAQTSAPQPAPPQQHQPNATAQPMMTTTSQAPSLHAVQPPTEIIGTAYPGYAIYQPHLYAAPPADQAITFLMQQRPPQQSQGQHPSQADPNAFMRQMQIQYAVPQGGLAARPLHSSQMMPLAEGRPLLASAPSAVQAAPPAVQVQPAPAPKTTPKAVPKPPPTTKRVSTTKANVKPPSSTTPLSTTRTNVVSCSDTDGETKTADGTGKTKKPGVPIPKVAEPQKKPEAEKDTANMTQEEKAKANRDRNREHARNTRLRKKAYLEKLKTTVDELCRERDSLVLERAGAANLLVEMHNTRTEVLMSFFALRSSFEQQRELWSSILDESCFACVMPVTPYRSFPASEVQVSKCQRTILGIDGMMADTASLHVLLNTLVDRSRYPSASIQFRYTLVSEDAVVAGNQMMARWGMSTLNATQLGARMEVAKQGMLCCKFNSAHKIIGLELMFDVMAFMLQLKQAAGSETFSVVPNTVQTCQRSFSSPMVMTLAERPYTIVQVNKLWEDMTGYKAEDVVGKASCRVLQGQETDRAAVEALMASIRFKRPVSAVLLNYTRQGKRFHNFIDLYPLSTDSKITHYVGLTAHVDSIDGNGGTSLQTSRPQPAAPSQMPKPATPLMPPNEVIPQLTNLQGNQQFRISPSTGLGNHHLQTVAGHPIGGHIPVTYVASAPQPILSNSSMAPALLPNVKASSLAQTSPAQPGNRKRKIDDSPTNQGPQKEKIRPGVGVSKTGGA